MTPTLQQLDEWQAISNALGEPTGPSMSGDHKRMYVYYDCGTVEIDNDDVDREEARKLAEALVELPIGFRAAIAALAARDQRIAELERERDKAVESIRQCRVFLRGCMNHAFDETPIVEVAKDVSEEFHRNRYQLQCMAKVRDGIAKERDAANILLKRLMCVVVPDNAVPNDMKEFVRDSAATVLKDLWDYLKTDADLRNAEHDAR